MLISSKCFSGGTYVSLEDSFIMQYEVGQDKTIKVICDDKDREYLRKIRKEYKNLVRNIWNPFDKNHEKILGCTTVNTFV